jgi:hypothetical protein
MGERRNATRQRSFLRGCLYFNKRRNAVDCLIRDISETGARVVFSDTVIVPDVVELYIPQKEQTLRAEVQWRHGEELGLAFANNAAQANRSPDDADLTQRVTKLEAEVAALRRIVKQIRSEMPGGSDEAA